MKRALAASALAALLLGMGCAAPTEPPPPTTIQVLDKTRLTAVEAALKTDSELAGAGLQVSARHDTVVLAGTVPSAKTRQRAEDLARRVHGIEKVENQIRVVPAP